MAEKNRPDMNYFHGGIAVDEQPTAGKLLSSRSPH
jgi:hypothetical protein